jgi:hypothetical protein
MAIAVVFFMASVTDKAQMSSHRDTLVLLSADMIPATIALKRVFTEAALAGYADPWMSVRH